ncbi:kinase-like domain-containing protein [Dissophora ornata]|nr:kinase-like domain-containing protein [Dissophora ornata]
MERVASTGSLKRPSLVPAPSSTGPASPVGSLSASSLSLPDDSFSNNPEDYDIRLPIGYGSSAVVYNAYYKPLNKKVAIKVIDLDMFERNQIDELRRETQVMALCKHPNVLRVNGAFVTDSKLYIVTPYLSAGSCLDIMRAAFPDGFDEISIATILKQALQGLDYLHKNGHIHRDVKAGNLLMDDDGSVLLADFGVSSSLMETGDRRGMRKTFVGTPCWMAPEVMEQAGYDYKADIWSFGITAIELATGHAPFAKYPPIKVLMLTLSNDPPTLDRESTKHRYSKLLKEMIDSCLQKDPAKRPSAEKLLSHSFFKQAKKTSYLVTALLQTLPPLDQRSPRKPETKPVLPEKGVSWDFDADDAPAAAETVQGPNVEPVRRPRTVTFQPSAIRPLSASESSAIRPLSASESSHSTGTSMTPSLESRTIDSLPEDMASSQGSTPQSTYVGDKPVKKSRFVVEDASIVSSPTIPHATENLQSPQAINYPAHPPAPIQTGQNWQGLGVSHGVSDPSAPPEVRKGRFSVKDTSLGASSPVLPSIKTMPGESMITPSRSLSSSPVEGTPDGVRIGTPLELIPPSERKSRFEVHHTHSTPTSGAPISGAPILGAPILGAPISTNGGAGTSSPTVATIHGTPLSRESSQSRVAGDTGLTRENSTTRISRFSVEPSPSPVYPEGPINAVVSSAGTPNSANGSVGSLSKRSRFQVSSVEGSRSGGDHLTPDTSGSVHSTPTNSPTGSLSRGQPALLEALGAQSVYGHLDTLLKQNEQQRVVLTELFAGFGLKAGSSSKAPGEISALHGMSSSGGSVHRQEPVTAQMTVERQLQVAARENESLRRENEALKRELDRLRRGGQ